MIRVVLIEDDADHESIFRRALRDYPRRLDLTVAKDGQEGVDILLGMTDVPDLVFVDLNLPLVNGHEVLRRIRAVSHLEFLPLVVLSTSRTDSDVAQAYKNGANSFLVKPADYIEFKDLVISCIEYWADKNVSLSKSVNGQEE